jgi:hypothetical protein
LPVQQSNPSVNKLVVGFHRMFILQIDWAANKILSFEGAALVTSFVSVVSCLKRSESSEYRGLKDDWQVKFNERYILILFNLSNISLTICETGLVN